MNDQKSFQPNQILIGIILLSVALRVAAAMILGDQVTTLPGIADQISYHELALRVLGGHGFTFGQNWWPATDANAPTAHWSYLYTFYLTAVYALVGPHPLAARVLQAILVGVLHPFLAYHMGKYVFSRAAGLAAAGLTAIYTPITSTILLR
jgi:4-amino-4-deoxy-L-arabinose transferase-like glycosyltransferase